MYGFSFFCVCFSVQKYILLRFVSFDFVEFEHDYRTTTTFKIHISSSYLLLFFFVRKKHEQLKPIHNIWISLFEFEQKKILFQRYDLLFSFLLLKKMFYCSKHVFCILYFQKYSFNNNNNNINEKNYQFST